VRVGEERGVVVPDDADVPGHVEAALAGGPDGAERPQVLPISTAVIPGRCRRGPAGKQMRTFPRLARCRTPLSAGSALVGGDEGRVEPVDVAVHEDDGHAVVDPPVVGLVIRARVGVQTRR